MAKKIALALITLVVLCGVGVGVFFIIKNASEEQHKKDIEMAADCAKTYERPTVESGVKSYSGGYVSTGAYEKTINNRNSKRQECAEKYHVTHQEIIDKIGSEDY